MPWGKAPGTGIEPAAFSLQSQTQLPTVATPGQVMRRTERCWLSLRRARGRGFEPLSPDSKSGSLPLADPRISSLRVPCGNRTRLSSLEGWRLCRSANGTCFVTSGRSESRTRKAVSVLGRFRGGCHHQLACPSVFLSSGGRNRTCTHPLNRRLPYRLATPEYWSLPLIKCHLMSCQRSVSRLDATKKHGARIKLASPRYEGRAPPRCGGRLP